MFSIKNIFGFYPRNIFLYKLAFRHKSVASEIINGIKICNERLEYLGDAVLSWLGRKIDGLGRKSDSLDLEYSV